MNVTYEDDIIYVGIEKFVRDETLMYYEIPTFLDIDSAIEKYSNTFRIFRSDNVLILIAKKFPMAWKYDYNQNKIFTYTMLNK